MTTNGTISSTEVKYSVKFSYFCISCVIRYKELPISSN